MNVTGIVFVIRSVCVCFLAILTMSCGSSGGSSSTPPSGGGSSTTGDKYNITSYAGKLVSGVNLYGVWIMAGEESITLSNATQTRSGTGKRREIFAFKRSSTPGETLMRTCGSSLWFPVSTALVDLPTVSVFDTVYEPVSGSKMNVTRKINTSDSDGSMVIDGKYTAVKLFDDPEASLGKLTLYALVTDFESQNLSKKLIANNDLFNVYCFMEFENPVALGIDITNAHTMQVFYDGGTSTTDENQISLMTISTTLPEPGYTVSLDHNAYPFGAVGDKELITLKYNTNNSTLISLDFDASTFDFNGSPDNAVGNISIDL